MQFDHFSKHLQKQLTLALPGKGAHDRMASPNRKSYQLQVPANARQSAVLLLLYPLDGDIYFPVIRRPTYDGVHSGQIALPGGRMEPNDPNEATTARRETEEEIGVLVTENQLIGRLTELYIPPSNSLVHPFVALTPQRPQYLPDPNEVEQIFDIPLSQLKSPDYQTTADISIGQNLRFKAPAYLIHDQIIWGATAMILSEFLEVMERVEIK